MASYRGVGSDTLKLLVSNPPGVIHRVWITLALGIAPWAVVSRYHICAVALPVILWAYIAPGKQANVQSVGGGSKLMLRGYK